ncbi:MAG: hypothetical protein ACR2F2_13735 [Pyrinomonadaceae bacterium]
MKNFSKKLFNLTSAIFIFTGLTAAAFGQATIITQEEFERKIDNALQTAETTFPRRETESIPKLIEVFIADQNEPVETILNENQIKEFLAKDKVRYEFIKVTTKGTTSTIRTQIGLYCYDESDGTQWATYKIPCDRKFYSISMPPEKKEFFVENGSLDAKPVKIFRAVETGRVYSKGESPYINEYLYYLDSAGRLIKREYLARKGEEKPNLEISTIYDYEVKIEPILAPDAVKLVKK